MKDYIYLLFIFSSFLLLSCNNEDSLSPDISPSKELNTKENFCLDAYLPEEVDSIYTGITTNAALLKSKKWNNGQIIKIKFLNGTPFLQSKVKQFAEEWLKYANLKFQYVDSNQNADIRINFDNSGGSWSYLGTDCNRISPNQPSMNFGWFTNFTSDTEFSRVIIHEFGHALGLIHEHQSPASNIQWNKSKVYEYYGGAPNYWNQDEVDNNIFYKYSSTVTNYSAFDSKSIMLYSFPSSFTLNGWSSGWNTVLSQTDKNFIAKEYPGKTINQKTNNLYRYNINGQHFYTSNYAELGNNYYESILGKIYSSQISNTYPIYRYFNTINGDRLSTLNWNELRNGGQDGWKYEGISGYAYNIQQSNTIPIYRYFKSTNKPDHLLTTSNTEVAGGKFGYKYEGIAFYVLR